MTSENRINAVQVCDPEHDGVAALVITPNENDRLCLRAAFEGARCKPLFARNGFEARTLLAAESVRVVIMDGDLRSPSWREMLEQISALEADSAPKLIVVSRLADDRLWAEVLNLGGYDLLPKPLDAAEVAWVVRSALSERNRTRCSVWPAGVKEQGAWNGY